MLQTSRTWSVIWHDRESLISTVGRRAAFQPSCGRSGPGWRVAVLRVAFMKKEEKVSGSCDWQSGWGLGGQRGAAPSVSVCWANLDEAPVWVMARAHVCPWGGTWAHAEEQSSLATLATTETYLQRDLGTLQLLQVPAQT